MPANRVSLNGWFLRLGRDYHNELFLRFDGKPLNIKAFDSPDKGAKNILKSRTWYRLLAEAEVRPRRFHNIRGAGVTNLAANNVSMDLIVEVTGQTIAVAREYYLNLPNESQRNTMDKLVALYSVPELPPVSDHASSLWSTPEKRQIKCSNNLAGKSPHPLNYRPAEEH